MCALLASGVELKGQKIALAVLDFDGIGISQTEATALSNRLRNELFRLGKFNVVDRGMMLSYRISRFNLVLETGIFKGESEYGGLIYGVGVQF